VTAGDVLLLLLLLLLRPTKPFVDGEMLPLAVHRAVPGDSKA
jgi:hypothetical protein